MGVSRRKSSFNLVQGVAKVIVDSGDAREVELCRRDRARENLQPHCQEATT